MKQYIACGLFLLLFTGVFSVAASGQQTPAKPDDLVTRLIHTLPMDLTGAQSGVDQLLKRNFFNLPEQKNKKLKQAFNKGYDEKYLLDIFKDSLQEKMTPELRKETSAWLKRPSTQTVLQANRQYHMLQGKRKRVIAMYKIDQNPPKPARKHLLAELWNTTADLSRATSVAVIMLRSMIKAYDELNDKQHYSDARIDQIVQNYKTHVLLPSAQAAKKSGARSLAVKYYNVKTEELRDYLSFLKSDTGQSLITTIAKSMQAAYKVRSQRFLSLVEKSVIQ